MCPGDVAARVRSRRARARTVSVVAISKRTARRTTGVLVALLATHSVANASDPPRPPSSQEAHLTWNDPILCLRDSKRRNFHVQRSRERFLVAIAEDPSGEPLDRLAYCNGWITLEALHKEGLALVPAVAEVSPGWQRDSRGRVFQVSFDMLRRVYLGVGYNPAVNDTDRTLGRMRLELGLVASWFESNDRTRHTIEALQGDISMPSVRGRVLALSYEMNRSAVAPFLRLPTFFGQPKRHDLNMDIGFGFRLLDATYGPHRIDSLFDFEYAHIYGTWALCYSSDMASHVVLRAGGNIGQLNDREDRDRAFHFLGPVASLDGRLLVDRAGFHQLQAVGFAQMRVYTSGMVPGTSKLVVGGALAYEWILLAVNDQPVSLRLETSVSQRNDLPQRAPSFDAQAVAGLRLSLWAPERNEERLP